MPKRKNRRVDTRGCQDVGRLLLDADDADLDTGPGNIACKLPHVRQRTAAGEREAFDVIVERHRRAVYQVCFRFVNNHEDASDLAQDAFVRAWKGLGNFKGQSALSTWLHRIAVNVCLNRVAVKKLPSEPIDDRQHVDMHAESASERMLRDERAVRVRAAIAQLPRKQRATLILRMYHEMSHQEIAEALGSTVGAVKANFFHALGNLKKRLGEL